MSSKKPTPHQHLPYAVSYHTPVLVNEVLQYLNIQSAGVYVDGTLGGGGHSKAILDASAPDGKLLAIDRDNDALEQSSKRLAPYGDRVVFWHGNYSQAKSACQTHGFDKVDGFLVDAGVSSHQLDTPERGFSFQKDGPLDMRMGQDGLTVEQYLQTVTQRDLARVLGKYGEVRPAMKLAAAILDAVQVNAMHTTGDLRQCVENVLGNGSGVGRKTKIHPATLVFQALRIAINRELEHLQAAIEQIPNIIKPGGRAVFISFHSLEDRIVKHGFRDLANACICPPGLPVCNCEEKALVKILTSRPISGSDDEINQNPRARSARLRAVEVL